MMNLRPPEIRIFGKLLLTLLLLSFFLPAVFAEQGKNYVYRKRDGTILLTDRKHGADYATLLKVFESRKEIHYQKYGDYFRNKYRHIVRKYANYHGIDPKVIEAVIQVESGYDYMAVSPANAKGLMQLMDPTAREMGVTNVFDPEQNIMGGTGYLSKLIDRYNGNLTYALAAYNAGPTRVDRYKGVPPFKETRRYIKKIKSALNSRGVDYPSRVHTTKPLRKKKPTKLIWKKVDGQIMITAVPIDK